MRKSVIFVALLALVSSGCDILRSKEAQSTIAASAQFVRLTSPLLRAAYQRDLASCSDSACELETRTKYDRIFKLFEAVETVSALNDCAVEKE